MNQRKPPTNSKEVAEQSPPPAQQGQPAASAEVPERPALAPNVQLIGEMKETGYTNRQWLVQRNGQFIQLTELLYRVAEQANGERTLGEIAARVTESTEWMVSADNVRQLIRAMLIPMGLVAAADGAVASRGENRARSPLALNMRTTVLGPRTIDPITRVLQVLYAPPIFVLVLLAIAIVHTWLYLIHGVGSGVREMLYTPSLTLPVLAIVFVSGIFHEFGHASALRYGGGKVRGMGFGLYLVYPALYTDTTDSYRLGRWARVRTDIGGFYFHLIFALSLIGLYLVTGWEFLLVAVLLINLDIVYQCLPFVRFDGYWALADLTGIPDFFSQMGAFLRSVLPISRWEGSKLPNLKPWVKVVFATYVIVTIPVLSLLLFVLIIRLPWIVDAFWESLLIQAHAFSSALGGGDPFGATASTAQMLFLGLQALAITYLLFRLSRMLAAAARRLIGTARHPERENL